MNLPGLQAVLLGIIEVQPLNLLLRRLAEAALELTGADYAAIGAYGPDRHLEHFEAFGLSAGERGTLTHAPHGVGLLGEFAVRHQTINIPPHSRHPATTGFPDGHPKMDAFLGVPIVYAGDAIGAFYVTRRPGAPGFSTADQSQLEALAPYAALAIHNARLLERERQQRSVAEAIATAASAIPTMTDAAATARLLARATREALPRCIEAAVGWMLPDDINPHTESSEDGEQVVLAPWLVTRMREGLKPGRHEELGPRGRMLAMYVADLDDGGEIVFAVCPDGPLSSAEHVALRAVQELGVIGFVSLLRRQAQNALDHYVVRDAIARDLHDDIIQAIYAVGLGLHRARTRNDVSKDDAIERATADLNGVIADLRAYIHHLTGDDEPAAGLLAARLRTLFDQPKSTAWTTRIELGGEPLGAFLERQVYLLARELISNVERHAQATSATLHLFRPDAERIRLEVRDDGHGFNPRDVAPSKVGIRSIEQRVAELDGSVILDTRPGAGTSVTIDIPLVRERNSAR